MHCIRHRLRDTAAQSMPDYALLAGLIALALVAAVTTLGGAVSDAFTSLTGRIGTTMTHMAEGS
jgi:Flp pilus assembly pilin Flp